LSLSPEVGRTRFHEIPLVLFTALVMAGAGLAGSHMVFGYLSWVPWVPSRGVLLFSAALMGAGLAVSALHLGQPLRGYRALARVGRSPLSDEIVALGTTLVLTLAAAFLPGDHPAAPVLWTGAAIFALLTLLAVGRIYKLPGQLTWSGPAVVQPLVLGLGLGLTVLLGHLDEGVRGRAELIVLLVFAADGLLVWERTRRLSRSLARGVPVHPGLMEVRAAGLGLRVVLGVLGPAAALLGGLPALATGSLSMNLILDRVLFYGLAILSSTEAEVRTVEALLRTQPLGDRGRPGSPSTTPSASEK